MGRRHGKTASSVKEEHKEAALAAARALALQGDGKRPLCGFCIIVCDVEEILAGAYEDGYITMCRYGHFPSRLDYRKFKMPIKDCLSDAHNRLLVDSFLPSGNLSAIVDRQTGLVACGGFEMYNQKGESSTEARTTVASAIAATAGKCYVVLAPESVCGCKDRPPLPGATLRVCDGFEPHVDVPVHVADVPTKTLDPARCRLHFDVRRLNWRLPLWEAQLELSVPRDDAVVLQYLVRDAITIKIQALDLPACIKSAQVTEFPRTSSDEARCRLRFEYSVFAEVFQGDERNEPPCAVPGTVTLTIPHLPGPIVQEGCVWYYSDPDEDREIDAIADLMRRNHAENDPERRLDEFGYVRRRRDSLEAVTARHAAFKQMEQIALRADLRLVLHVIVTSRLRSIVSEVMLARISGADTVESAANRVLEYLGCNFALETSWSDWMHPPGQDETLTVDGDLHAKSCTGTTADDGDLPGFECVVDFRSLHEQLVRASARVRESANDDARPTKRLCSTTSDDQGDASDETASCVAGFRSDVRPAQDEISPADSGGFFHRTTFAYSADSLIEFDPIVDFLFPDDDSPGEDANPTVRDKPPPPRQHPSLPRFVAHSEKKEIKTYKCSRCGHPKASHVCSALIRDRVSVGVQADPKEVIQAYCERTIVARSHPLADDSRLGSLATYPTDIFAMPAAASLERSRGIPASNFAPPRTVHLLPPPILSGSLRPPLHTQLPAHVYRLSQDSPSSGSLEPPRW